MLSIEPTQQQSGMLGAYAAERNGKTMIALVNKALFGDRDLIITADKSFHRATRWSLTGPALDATHGLEFRGAVVSSDGTWSPRSEPLQVRNKALRSSS